METEEVGSNFVSVMDEEVKYPFDLNVAADTLFVCPYIQEIFDYLRE